jgi:hypothetical protein
LKVFRFVAHQPYWTLIMNSFLKSAANHLREIEFQVCLSPSVIYTPYNQYVFVTQYVHNA